MGANEPPYIGETLPGATTYDFEPNMVFAVEPLVWVPDIRGGGGVRIGTWSSSPTETRISSPGWSTKSV
jgi:hypothetical protein